MTQYNLIRNGVFVTVTGTGYGNNELTWTELETLIDGVTTSGGVSVSAPDITFLSADLSNRIKVDGINLYTNNAAISANVYFYYKNAEADSYSLSPTSVNGTTYSTTLTDPSAPRFVSVVVSGVSADLYEYEIFNDDYIVAFGEDGSMYAKYIDNAAVGEESATTIIPIYNNGTSTIPANAYVCVDWTDAAADYYVEIANSSNGPWYDLEDGAILDSGLLSDTYSWNMGGFYNTLVSGASEYVRIDDTTLGSGTYVSPIFKLDNKKTASYFVTDITTTSGVTSMHYSDNTTNTIRVRSGSVSPIPKESIYLSYGSTDDSIYNADPFTNIEEYPWKSIVIAAGSGYTRWGQSMDVHNATGRVVYSSYRRQINTTDSQLYIFDKDGNELYSATTVSEFYSGNVGLEFDYSGGVWVANSVTTIYDTSYTLMHFDSTLGTVLMTTGDVGYDFLGDMAAEIDGDGLWYTNTSSNSIIHIDYEGTVLFSKTLTNPTVVATTPNGGCWVYDATSYTFYKYDSIGTQLKSVTGEASVVNMDTDHIGGFWYTYSTMLCHCNSNGTKDIEVVVSDAITSIRAGYTGCAVFARAAEKVRWVDKDSEVVARIYDLHTLPPNNGSVYTSLSYVGVEAINYDTYKDSNVDYTYFPRASDPVWGVNGSLEWKEVNKDGYFLPREEYHQVEFMLRTTVSGQTPQLNKLVMAPVVQVTDIQSKSSRDMYIKSNIPSYLDARDYETKLKCWWELKNA